jgi:hypothetical protein
VVEVDKCVDGPQSLAELFPGHQVARPFEQHREHLERLLLEPDPQPTLPEFAGPKIKLENAKTDTAGTVSGGVHGIGQPQ